MKLDDSSKFFWIFYVLTFLTVFPEILSRPPSTCRHFNESDADFITSYHNFLFEFKTYHPCHGAPFKLLSLL